jgi:hypothetical protein
MAAISVKLTNTTRIEHRTIEAIEVGPSVEVCRKTSLFTGPRGGNQETHTSEFVRFTGKTKDEYHGGFSVHHGG